MLFLYMFLGLICKWMLMDKWIIACTINSTGLISFYIM